MPRPSRRDQLLVAALALFTERGYEGTTVSDIAAATGVTKAAISYHFPAKEDLLRALTEPLLDSLEAVVERHPPIPEWPAGLEALLTDYLDVLVDRQELVEWIDGDKAVLRHPDLGPRLQANNRAMRQAINGGLGTAAARLAASAALGMFWRPLRNLRSIDPGTQRATLIELAMVATRHTRT